MSTVDFFLGAGSPGGFAGYFSSLCDLDSGLTSTLIKAGPGCGKSSLMRRIAQHLSDGGSMVECIHCSSDPNSLDGVICKEKKFGILDATAPHAVDPKYPIAVEKVLSLFHLLDEKHLIENRGEIVRLFDKNSCYHDRASRYITSAGSLLQDNLRIFSFCTNISKLDAFCKRLSAKKLKKIDKPGYEHRRLLSAVTPDGVIFYGNTIKSMAKNIVVLDDEIGFVAKYILAHIKKDALDKGHEIYTCYCPMFPYEKIDHIIIPSLSLAFVTKNHYLAYDYGEIEVIKSSRFILPERYKERKKRLKFNRTITAELLSQAQAMLKNAKDVHDQIEQYYITAMNFSGIDRLYEKVKEDIYL